jgi:hypothetical protein
MIINKDSYEIILLMLDYVCLIMMMLFIIYNSNKVSHSLLSYIMDGLQLRSSAILATIPYRVWCLSRGVFGRQYPVTH